MLRDEQTTAAWFIQRGKSGVTENGEQHESEIEQSGIVVLCVDGCGGKGSGQWFATERDTDSGG